MTLSVTNTTGGTATAVGGAVAYKGAGAFVKLTPGVYDLATRTAGATSDAITRAAVSFVAGRTYTMTARGDITVDLDHGDDPTATGQYGESLIRRRGRRGRKGTALTLVQIRTLPHPVMP